MYLLLVFSLLFPSSTPGYEGRFKTADACLAAASKLNGPDPDNLRLVDRSHIHICYKMVAPT